MKRINIHENKRKNEKNITKRKRLKNTVQLVNYIYV